MQVQKEKFKKISFISMKNSVFANFKDIKNEIIFEQKKFQKTILKKILISNVEKVILEMENQKIRQYLIQLDNYNNSILLNITIQNNIEIYESGYLLTDSNEIGSLLLKKIKKYKNKKPCIN